MQGLLPFVLEGMKHHSDLTAQAGLTLVAETMLALGLDDVVGRRLALRRRRRGFGEFELILAAVLLQAAGGDRVEDIRVLRGDEGLQELLTHAIPAPDALHRFLRACHDDEEMARRPPQQGAWIPRENDVLRVLHEVNVALVHRAASLQVPGRATLDLDATIIESHKRDALRHYKGGRGYQPVAVVWAEQDLVVADEFRDGNVPAGMDPLTAAQRAFAALPSSVQHRRFRGDSACYEEKMLKWLCAQQVEFTISADMSRELRSVCLDPQWRWESFEERTSETVDLADVEFTPGDWPKDAAPLRYVAIRFTGRQGRLFSDGTDTKYLAVASNRWKVSARQLVRWHWGKAGTIEHVHHVTKNELAAGMMPSGRFGANAAWYRINLITYNVLSVLRRHVLPERLRDARPKRLRFEVFTVPAKLGRHARQLTAHLGAPPLTVDELVAARGRLLELQSEIDRG